MPIMVVAKSTYTTNETNMENVSLTLPGGLKVEAGRMTVEEAKAFDAKLAVPASTVDTLAESVGILAQTNAILAIRLVRAVMGTGLRDSKLFMERARDERIATEARWKAAQVRIDAESERLRQEEERR